MKSSGKTILIGVTSGIAAFKIVQLVRDFRRRGYEIIVLMTDNAKKMISADEFEAASGNRVAHELFPNGFDYKTILKTRTVEHISLAEKASLVCVAPATANVVAKIAHGIADDLLTTVLLATKAPVLLCPSMNVNMWRKSVTQANISTLLGGGYRILEPAKGALACGYEGQGRLPDIAVIKREMTKLLDHGCEMAGKTVVVTAGGTEEPIDDVRVISNRSSGKMGIAIAEEFARRGAEVILIRGRTEVDPFAQMKDIRVGTAREMKTAIHRYAKKCDAVIHAAAVSDYRVRSPIRGKIDSGDREMSLDLVANPKIIDTIKAIYPKTVLVGFKAVVDQPYRNLKQAAVTLAKRSKCDLVVANDVGKTATFGSDDNQVVFVRSSGRCRALRKMSKHEIAEELVTEVRQLLNGR
ncbi:MAG TPA: bifunctional phosphopantothenoylcysteine decarboxylase/phosphopantothenate--cysteine ligase CoaBC [Bdellovibrionota bacterium]|nr:bifunctional phosphopantothenoylcysteine decarboxylase/phosphopantothenate--cysteine ligase CoaBC [Bdellovibrionota bacterium]